MIDKLVEIIKEDLITVLKAEKETDGYLDMADYATMVDRSDAVMLDSTIRARAIGALAGCYYHRDQKGENFEEFIQRAEATGKYHQSFSAHQEMHFSNGKIVKLKAQLWRNVSIGRLLKGEHNIQPDRFGSHVMGPTVGRLHNSRSAPGNYNVGQFVGTLAFTGNQTCKFSCFGVVFAIRKRLTSPLQFSS